MSAEGSSSGGGKKGGWIVRGLKWLGSAAVAGTFGLVIQGIARRVAPTQTRKLLGE